MSCIIKVVLYQGQISAVDNCKIKTHVEGMVQYHVVIDLEYWRIVIIQTGSSQE